MGESRCRSTSARRRRRLRHPGPLLQSISKCDMKRSPEFLGGTAPNPPPPARSPHLSPTATQRPGLTLPLLVRTPALVCRRSRRRRGRQSALQAQMLEDPRDHLRLSDRRNPPATRTALLAVQNIGGKHPAEKLRPQVARARPGLFLLVSTGGDGEARSCRSDGARSSAELPTRAPLRPGTRRLQGPLSARGRGGYGGRNTPLLFSQLRGESRWR